MQQAERFHTVVIGGGQAGLAIGHHLKKQGVSFVILDAGPRVGDAWRNRWDSLVLFTPARYDGLPGMRFPARGDHFPTKDEMADYLESYALRFELPVRLGVRVDSLAREGATYVVTSGEQRWEADHVVVAMSDFQRRRVPPFAAELDSRVVQLHSADYRGPAQLRDGAVLLVGTGNSGADIGMELAGRHEVFMAGPDRQAVPFRIETFVGRNLLVRAVRFVGHNVLSVRTPIGRKAQRTLRPGSDPLIRVKPRDLVAAGVQRVGRVAGVRDGLPLLDDGRVLDVANVLWCTGYQPAFSWIDLPVFGEDGTPRHHRGVVADEPGMYFLGLFFLTSMTSSTVTGVGRDARHIAGVIAQRTLVASRAAERAEAVRAAA